MSEQIASSTAMVKDAVIRFFGDASQARETSADTKVIFMIQTVLYRTLAKSFRSADFYSTVAEAVYRSVREHLSTDAGAKQLGDASFFTVPVAKIFKHEVEKYSFDKAKIQGQFVTLSETVEEKKGNVKEGITTERTDPAQFPSSQTDIFDDKKQRESVQNVYVFR